MSNSLDPDQARRIVGSDLGPNCLPRLSADDTGRQRVKFPMFSFHIFIVIMYFLNRPARKKIQQVIFTTSGMLSTPN